MDEQNLGVVIQTVCKDGLQGLFARMVCKDGLQGRFQQRFAHPLFLLIAVFIFAHRSFYVCLSQFVLLIAVFP